MSDCLNKVLSMDEGSQRATLDSLSNYWRSNALAAEVSKTNAVLSEGVRGADTPPGLGADSSVGQLPLGSRASSEAAAAAAASAAATEAPPGLEAFCCAGDDSKGMPTWSSEFAGFQHPEHSEWQPWWLGAGGAGGGQAQPYGYNSAHVPRLQGVGGGCAAEGGFGAWSDDGLPDKNDCNPEVFSMLEKAVGHLMASLSPRSAAEATEILVRAGGASPGEAPRPGACSAEAMQWLMQHLERQQMESMQKVRHMMQSEQPGSHLPLASIKDWTSQYERSTSGTASGAPLAGSSSDSFRSDDAYSTWGAPEQAAAAAVAASPPPTRLSLSAPAAASGPTELQQKKSFNKIPKHGDNNGNSHAGSSAVHEVDWMPEEWRQHEQHGCCSETLRVHLQSLLTIEPARVLLIRKINRLGFASASMLEQHYSWYGPVERVMVAHSRVKTCTAQGAAQGAAQLAAQDGEFRLRPAGLGFVVMRREEDARMILLDGAEQVVQGAIVRVQQFERRISLQMSGSDDSEDRTETETNSEEPGTP